MPSAARCEVPENPQDPKGRKIGLRVAQVRAISQRKIADPLFLLAGGPGSAATRPVRAGGAGLRAHPP